MAELILFDVAPGPVGIGVLLAVVLLVVGFILLLAAGLGLFLWCRKRSMRGIEMIRADRFPTAPHAQANNPNQP